MKDVQEWLHEQLQRDPAFRVSQRENAWKELQWCEEAEPMPVVGRQDAAGAWARFWLATECYRDACLAYGRFNEEREANPQQQGAVMKRAKDARAALDVATRRLLVVFGMAVSGRDEGEVGEACQNLAIATAKAGRQS